MGDPPFQKTNKETNKETNKNNERKKAKINCYFVVVGCVDVDFVGSEIN